MVKMRAGRPWYLNGLDAQFWSRSCDSVFPATHWQWTDLWLFCACQHNACWVHRVGDRLSLLILSFMNL